jgi:outer membrane receptor protein involved in Fe transport
MKAVAVVGCLLYAAVGLAQQQPKVDTVNFGRRTPARRDSLPEVTIRGYQDPGSVRNALSLQRSAAQIIDILPEEAIQRSTDLTVADVTRRINGLSVTKDASGESDRTIIRGMDPAYNYTLVDGIKIPSPGDKSRYVPLSLFPADMVARVEVYKNLTPDMEGDAIGGVVNMVMRNAPEQPLLKVRLMTGYDQTFFDGSYESFDRHVIHKKSPFELHGSSYQATGADFSKANLSFHDIRPAPDALASVTWGRRFAGQKLGVLLAADYQDIKRGSPDYFIPQNNQPQENNTPGLTDFYRNQYSSTLIREGIHSRLDYTFNSRNSISFYTFYASQQDIESRHRVDTSLAEGRSIPGTGRIEISDRSREHLQHIYNATLRGSHQLDSHFSIKWVGAYSVANGLYPDWAELSAGTARIEQPNGSVSQAPLLLDPLTRIWLRNRERDFSGYLYLDDHYNVGAHVLSLSAGGLYRDKQRDNFYNDYIFQPTITTNQGQPFTNIYGAQWLNDNGPQNPLGAVANPDTYTAHEYVGAGYFSLGWKGSRMEYLAGVRYEHTQQDFVSSVDPTVSYGKEGSISYADLLPSLQLKYRLTEHQQLRASWFKSISRPALYDVTFYSIQFEDYVEAGNPYLKRAQADNLDLRYELYTNGLDLLQTGIFYKHISNPYERTLLNAGDELYPIPDQGLPYTPAGQLTSQMRNAADANDYGLEFSASKNVGRLGVQAGYTYTYSRIVQPDKYVTRQNPSDPSSDLVTVTRNESRPLQGQSPNLANLSILYQDARHGWNARISGIYTGRRIYSASGWYGLDYWERGYTVIDASVEKKLGRHIRVFAKVNNLFNTVTTVDLMQPNPGFASGSLPGQQRADRITVMRQVDRPLYYLGCQWSLP